MLPSALFGQFRILCQAQSIELQSIKQDLTGKVAYPYLLAAAQIHRNSKFLYKKLIHNKIFKNAFKGYLLSKNLIPEKLEPEYMLDLLLVNILDQIFIQTVFLPNF
jgi:hypothetical protein